MDFSESQSRFNPLQVRRLDKIYRALQEDVFTKALTSFNRVCKRGGTASEGQFIADTLGLAINSAYNSIWQFDTGSECEILKNQADLLAGLAVAGAGEALTKTICCQPDNVETVKNDLYKKLHSMLQSLINTQCSDAQHDPGFLFSIRHKVYLASVDVSIQAAESVARCPVSASLPGLQPAIHSSVEPFYTPAAKATPVGSWPGYTLPLLATIQRCHGVAYTCCSGNTAWCNSLGYVQVRKLL